MVGISLSYTRRRAALDVEAAIAKEVKPSPTPLVPANSVELDRCLELSQDTILNITTKAHLAKITIGVASKFQFHQTCASQFFSIGIREEEYIDKQRNVTSTWGTAIDNWIRNCYFTVLLGCRSSNNPTRDFAPSQCKSRSSVATAIGMPTNGIEEQNLLFNFIGVHLDT